MVFNKSVQIHSESVFPSNVTVRTANALSYRYIEKTETSKRFVGWGVKYTDLLEHNLVPHRNTGKGTVWEGFNIYQRAAMIIETLHAYYLSIEENVQLEHAPKEWPVKLFSWVEILFGNTFFRSRSKENCALCQRVREGIWLRTQQRLYCYFLPDVILVLTLKNDSGLAEDPQGQTRGRQV